MSHHVQTEQTNTKVVELTTASWLANPSDGVSGHSVRLSVCLSVYVLLLPSCFVVCVVQKGGGTSEILPRNAP